jgi:hypothetical protein
VEGQICRVYFSGGCNKKNEIAKVYYRLLGEVLMRKSTVIGLILICLISVSVNMFQFYKIKSYKSEERFYNDKFKSNFDDLQKSFDLYNESGALSNDSAIKNSVAIVQDLKSIRELSSYKDSKPLSEMLLYLSEFFVIKSDQYINENLDKIRPQLKIISNNLNDENSIKEFNSSLWKLVSR